MSRMLTPADDTYLWLEEVEGGRPLRWVHQQNARTEAELASTDGFDELERRLREVLDSTEKIPFVRKVGDWLYNFWQDADHERGLWRRTTLEEYRKPEPNWETLLDLDALSAADGVPWVWHGADFLKPDNVRALVALSRGGSDADVTREFDVVRKAFVPGGFERPEAKGYLGWIDRDHVYVGTDFGPGSMTASGYPRLAKEWPRGTEMSAAAPVADCPPEEMAVHAYHDDTPGYERDFVVRRPAFFTEVLYHRDHGQLTKLEVPDSASKSVHRDWLLVRPREDWTVGATTYAAGCLLAARFEDWMSGDRSLEVLFEPDEHTSLQGWTWTLSHLVLDLLVDVKSRLRVLSPTDDGWVVRELPGTPPVGTVTASGVDRDECDDVWLTTTDFLTPSTLSLATVGDEGGNRRQRPGDPDGDQASPTHPEVLKRQPEFFDSAGYLTEQHFATSADGTLVPYFLVRPADLPFDGSTPTLLHGYGGYEVPMLPAYSGLVGRGWLGEGRAYAVANIRGGGEYGPRWHRAALRENRHLAYQDFAAVARDLADRKVTTPARLGAYGGSNGGLLIGNMLTRFPELFGAFVCYVPVLDMRRYTKLLAGASWAAEWGDPDVDDDWAYLRTYSPYHLLEGGRDYPPTFVWTTTRDDRVHPGHARKMAARMLELGCDVRYFENTEGGHGAGATNAQTARTWALTFAFLRSQLAR